MRPSALALIALLPVVTAGCVASETTRCPWGAICPPGMVCDSASRSCVLPGQREGCVGADDGDPCTFPNAPSGSYGCAAGLCVPMECGDGITGPDEACDDGNRLDGDGCSADCRSLEVCGNGVTDVVRGEQCDDGNRGSHDGCSSGCTTEVPRWSPLITPLGGRMDVGAAYDTARGRIVLFGGYDQTFFRSDTWEYNGTDWMPIYTPHHPPARQAAGLAYDERRELVVLFGGWTGAAVMEDTWEYNGVTWTKCLLDRRPPARSSLVMAYDRVRGVVVLFGGESGDRATFGDTWEFDGEEWNERPALGPPPRRYSAMAYDPRREKMVLFGGSDDVDPEIALADTWEFDGTGWEERLPATSPPPRTRHAMTWDPIRERVVISGGDGLGTIWGDTWAWDGTTWAETTPDATDPDRPQARRQHLFVFHHQLGRIVLYGGRAVSSTEFLGDTWLFDGTAWTDVSPPVPAAREGAAAAFLRGRGGLVLFGGHSSTVSLLYGDTWLFDGTAWSVVETASSPRHRSYSTMAYDADRDRLVLFGGGTQLSPDVAINDTWEFDGTAWTSCQTERWPEARLGHGMVYDEARGRMVLFGGMAGLDLPGTWEYDGTDWRRLAVEGEPQSRSFHGMAYDATRARMVVFGGIHGEDYLQDTWEFDGSEWLETTPDISPSPRALAPLAFHAAIGRIVLFGGWDGSNSHDDVWEYDGRSWRAIHIPPQPLLRAQHTMTWDPLRRVLLLNGGVSPWGSEADLWSYDYASDWPDEVCDNSADDDADGLIDCADPDCVGQVSCTR